MCGEHEDLGGTTINNHNRLIGGTLQLLGREGLSWRFLSNLKSSKANRVRFRVLASERDRQTQYDCGQDEHGLFLRAYERSTSTPAGRSGPKVFLRVTSLRFLRWRETAAGVKAAV